MIADITVATFNEVAHIVGFLDKGQFLFYNRKDNEKIKLYYKLCDDRQNLKNSIKKLLLEKKPLN